MTPAIGGPEGGGQEVRHFSPPRMVEKNPFKRCGKVILPKSGRGVDFVAKEVGRTQVKSSS
jgi:hypothetical protein